MKQFTGFPTKMQFTPLPNLFFTALLPQINDITELKTTLHILAALYRQRGYPRFITYQQLLGNKSLISSFKQATVPADQALYKALEMATGRGILLHITLNKDGVPQDAYFLNTESNKQVIAKIQSGELSLPGLKAEGQTYVETGSDEEQLDIFTLYEQNIGILTPMIAQELQEAEKVYPPAWITEAIKEAVALNKRSWRYIARILERWSAEGKGNGTYRKDFKKTDPDKYIKGKYGHMVRR